jgi:hypothetical protein
VLGSPRGGAANRQLVRSTALPLKFTKKRHALRDNSDVKRLSSAESIAAMALAPAATIVQLRASLGEG